MNAKWDHFGLQGLTRPGTLGQACFVVTGVIRVDRWTDSVFQILHKQKTVMIGKWSGL